MKHLGESVTLTEYEQDHQNKSLRDLFKVYCDANSDYAVVQAFLSFDPSLHKSKYVMKYLNNSKKKITM